MSWLFRSSTLVLVSVVLALSAATVMLWPGAPANRAMAQPVQEGDQEIVWLYAATNTAPWERFVTAVSRTVHRLHSADIIPGLELDAQNAFPKQTTTVPELALSIKGRKGKLWFRWYKLTGDQKTADWVRALLSRRPVPVAIIGGSSSDLAIELARELHEETSRQELGSAAPLLLLTAATADDAQPADVPLNSLYAGRTYRFCFTNRQMAKVVTDFIWSQDELRPDGDAVYSTFWEDDPFSADLNQRFYDALTEQVARTWPVISAELLGYGLLGFPVDMAEALQNQFTLGTHVAQGIPYSVGMFARPNRWELDAAHTLISQKISEANQRQKRPLLVLPASSQPCRRFLRALLRVAPLEARRFVVANGDGIAFNTLYRDRDVTWPIQDLPLPLVLFCHRNPVDAESGFVSDEEQKQDEADSKYSTDGTEDLLLFADIVEALVQGCYRSRGQTAAFPLSAEPEEVRQQFGQARWRKETVCVCFNSSSPLLFDEEGNRRSGTGEHVVYLRPVIQGVEVLPRSIIEVWSWHPDSVPSQRWEQRRILNVDYEGSQRVGE
jgi:hypothetical protein